MSLMFERKVHVKTIMKHTEMAPSFVQRLSKRLSPLEYDNKPAEVTQLNDKSVRRDYASHRRATVIWPTVKRIILLGRKTKAEDV